MLVECKTCEAVVDAQLIADYVHFNEEHVVQAKYSFLKCRNVSYHSLCFNLIIVMVMA